MCAFVYMKIKISALNFEVQVLLDFKLLVFKTYTITGRSNRF